MLRRLLLVAVLSLCGIPPSWSQAPEDPSPGAPLESPAPPPEAVGDAHSEVTPRSAEETNASLSIGESRGAVRLAPDHAGHRLALAKALYRIGDLDAAADECRVAIRLQPDDAKAHVQLGIILIAKQDWRAAASVLHEAIRLDPSLTDAHYSLASVHYSLGHLNAAVQSYRQALTLQPYFPDARYRLALLLRLSRQEQEAAQLMEEAARGGVAQAQFFLGNAYQRGQGVDKDLAQAIFWWTQAETQGYQAAAVTLSHLRRQALSPDQSERKRKEALDAFAAYRNRLWEEFRDYSRTDDQETIGTRLVKEHRGDVAVQALLKECYALSQTADAELFRLYHVGWNRFLPPFDGKILACFETTAADGFPPAKMSLARIYGKGIGLPPDVPRAKAAVKGLPKPQAKSLLDELGLR